MTRGWLEDDSPSGQGVEVLRLFHDAHVCPSAIPAAVHAKHRRSPAFWVSSFLY